MSFTNIGPGNEPSSIHGELSLAFDRFLASNPDAAQLQIGTRIKRFTHYVRQTGAAQYGTRSCWKDAGVPSTTLHGMSRSSALEERARSILYRGAPQPEQCQCPEPDILSSEVSDAIEIVSRCDDHKERLEEISTDLLGSLKELNDE